MLNYEDLQRELWREVLRHDKLAAKNAEAVFNSLMARLQKNGYRFDDESKQILADYYDSVTAFLQNGIKTAAAVSTANSMQSPVVLQAMKNAFNERWDDGSILSQRLWQHQRITAKNIESVLTNGIKQAKSNGALLYEIQYAVESQSGNKFDIISNNSNKWTTELKKSAQYLINNPDDKAAYDAIVKRTQKYIDKLAVTGTKNASQQLLNQIKNAVEKGNTAAVDNALKWWIYDKQLYNIKRISRTEMANAGHKAVIDTTIEDDTIIGYQWRLSSGHKKSRCICGYYASVDMGLGRGVWTKETVPRNKPHPHCMCLIIPRVTKIKTGGIYSIDDVMAYKAAKKL
jgi:hypothetical protein